MMRLVATLLLLVLKATAAQNCPTSAPNSSDSSAGLLGGYGLLGRHDDEETRYWSPENVLFGGAGTELLGCTSPADNARGYYNAHIAPCAFSFHSVTAAQSEQEDLDPAFHQTTVCSEENTIGSDSFMDYAKHWKDECVGDFARCYSVEEDEDIFLAFVCKKGWQFPSGTTHMSVDCSRDKEMKKVATDNYQHRYDSDKMVQHEEEREDARLDKEIRQREIAALFLLSFLSVSALCCCFAVYRWFALPYMQFLEETRSNKYQESETLVSRESKAQVV